MNETVRLWTGLLVTAIVVYLIVAPQMQTATVLKELGAFQIGAIRALQGRG